MRSQLPHFVLSQWSASAHKRVEVFVRSSKALGPDRLPSLRAEVARCFQLAERGAFPLGKLVPDIGLVDPASSESGSGQSLGRPFDLNDVDYRAFHVACNILAHAEDALVSVEFREAVEPGDHTGRSNWRLIACRDEAGTGTFPPMAETLPFHLVGEDPADQVKGRRLLVTVDVPFDVQSLARLIELINDWVSMLESGGYSSVDSGSVVTRGSLHAYDEYALELVLSLFEASEAAWFSLINVLRGFSASALRITEVAVE